MTRRTILLVTATISPDAALRDHTQFDPGRRRREYEDALRFHLGAAEGAVSHVILCENSGSDLEPFRAIAAERPGGPELRLVGYRSKVPPTAGKGRGEMELIDHAMAASADLFEPDDAIWKITGRLKLLNVVRMVETQPAAFDIYADFRDVPLIGQRLGGNQWVDTRAFAFSASGHARFLRGRWEEAWIVTEKYLFHEMSPHVAADPGIVPRLRSQPRFGGTSGGSGKDYASPVSHAKSLLRAATRRLAPALWL